MIYSYILAFGVEILVISYFSPLGPPLHSQCLLASAVIITFLSAEPPARNKSSSSGPPSGNTNWLSMNFSQYNIIKVLNSHALSVRRVHAFTQNSRSHAPLFSRIIHGAGRMSSHCKKRTLRRRLSCNVIC